MTRRTRQLREDSVAIIRRYQLEDIFRKAHDSLPEQYRRETVVSFADELMFAMGFAGVGGTTNGVLNVGSFLNDAVPRDAPADSVSVPTNTGDMPQLYRQDPQRFIQVRESGGPRRHRGCSASARGPGPRRRLCGSTRR